MNRFLLRSAAIAALVMQAAPALAAPPAPGRYEPVLLAVAPDGRVTGHFYEERGVGVTFSCAFTFSGKAGKSDIVPITAWVAWVDEDAMPRPGTLTHRGDEIVLRIPGARHFPGCGMVMSPQIVEGQAFLKTGVVRLTALVEVRVPRAPLRAGSGPARGRRYVVQDDILGVLDRRGSQLHVVYISPEGRESHGWVAAADTAALVPPG